MPEINIFQLFSQNSQNQIHYQTAKQAEKQKPDLLEFTPKKLFHSKKKLQDKNPIIMHKKRHIISPHDVKEMLKSTLESFHNFFVDEYYGSVINQIREKLLMNVDQNIIQFNKFEEDIESLFDTEDFIDCKLKY